MQFGSVFEALRAVTRIKLLAFPITMCASDCLTTFDHWCKVWPHKSLAFKTAGLVMHDRVLTKRRV
jgi:hypothetical protein